MLCGSTFEIWISGAFWEDASELSRRYARGASPQNAAFVVGRLPDGFGWKIQVWLWSLHRKEKGIQDGKTVTPIVENKS